MTRRERNCEKNGLQEIDMKTYEELRSAGVIELDCLRGHLVDSMGNIGQALSHLEGDSAFSYERGYIVGVLHGYEFAIDNVDVRRRVLTKQVLERHPKYLRPLEFSSYIQDRLKKLEHDGHV